MGNCKLADLFGVVSSLESAYAIKNMEDVKQFSPQYIMDCIPGGRQCDKYTDEASEYLDYLASSYGATVLESEDPYQAAPGKCPTNTSLNQGQVKKFKLSSFKTANNYLDREFAELVDKQPVLTYIIISKYMRFYKSGVYTPSQTECVRQAVDGIYINVDGYSMGEDLNGYYILKFPFGTDWGENGNMKFVKHKLNSFQDYDLCKFYRFTYILEAAST